MSRAPTAAAETIAGLLAAANHEVLGFSDSRRDIMNRMADEKTVNPPRHILVATDFSQGAQAAVARATQLAAEHSAQVTVVHVMPRDLPAAAARAAAHTLRAHVQAAPVAVRSEVLTGSTGAQVAATAAQVHADLVVIGAHGEQHRPHDLLVGTTAESTIDASDRPVLVVKKRDIAPYHTVLIAVDTSPRSVRTVQAAIALAPDAHHLIAHAVTVLGEQLLRLAGTDDQGIAQLRDRQLTEARTYLEHLTSQLTAPQPPQVVVEPGRPEHLVPDLAESRHADLVVVATKKITSVRHFIMGSVARHTIRHAGCDVLIDYPSPRPDPGRPATPPSQP